MPYDPRQDPRGQKEKMLAGDLYIADDPALAAEARRAYQLSQAYAAAYATDPAQAQALLVQMLGAVGDGVHIKPPF